MARVWLYGLNRDNSSGGRFNNYFLIACLSLSRATAESLLSLCSRVWSPWI